MIYSDAQRRAMFASMGNGAESNKFSYAALYSPADIPAMGVDAIGTAGAATLPWIPLGVALGAGYVGASMVLKGKNKLEEEYRKGKKKNKSSMSPDYYSVGNPPIVDKNKEIVAEALYPPGW